MTTTADQLKERLEVTPWRHTYDGMPIWEVGDGRRGIFTLGHVHKIHFVVACNTYYNDVVGVGIYEHHRVGLAQWASEVVHQKARIDRLSEFPAGEFEVLFGAGDVDVTVWAQRGPDPRRGQTHRSP